MYEFCLNRSLTRLFIYKTNSYLLFISYSTANIMSYAAKASNAIKTLGERGGSSLAAIKKVLAATGPVNAVSKISYEFINV